MDLSLPLYGRPLKNVYYQLLKDICRHKDMVPYLKTK